MNSTTVLDNIEYADAGSKIIINLTTSTIKVNRDNIGLIVKDDDDTVYVHDKANNRSYYIFAPSVEAIRVVGEI